MSRILGQRFSPLFFHIKFAMRVMPRGQSCAAGCGIPFIRSAGQEFLGRVPACCPRFCPKAQGLVTYRDSNTRPRPGLRLQNRTGALNEDRHHTYYFCCCDTLCLIVLARISARKCWPVTVARCSCRNVRNRTAHLAPYGSASSTGRRSPK